MLKNINTELTEISGGKTRLEPLNNHPQRRWISTNSKRV